MMVVKVKKHRKSQQVAAPKKKEKHSFDFSIFLKDERMLQRIQEIEPIKQKQVILPYYS